MATQRAFPIEDLGSQQTIAINGSYQPSPSACIILASQTVSFTNSSGSPVAIRFVPNPVNPTAPPVFTDIPNLPSNNLPSPPQSPNVSNGNGSVNYNIIANGKSYGPFAIQVGNGPLQVSITTISGNINVTPQMFTIPAYNNALQIAGTVALVPDNNQYTVAWPGGDPLQPPLTSADSQPHGDTNSSAVGDYQFTVTLKQLKPTLGTGGGGTVRIKST